MAQPPLLPTQDLDLGTGHPTPVAQAVLNGLGVHIPDVPNGPPPR
jgi:hypothetical protein